MRRCWTLALILAVALPGCTTYYDSVHWQDDGLAAAIWAAPPQGWTMQEQPGWLVLTKDGLVLSVPRPPSQETSGEGTNAPTPTEDPTPQATLGRTGRTSWSDNRLEDVVHDLYDELGRERPMHLEFGHLHGD